MSPDSLETTVGPQPWRYKVLMFDDTMGHANQPLALHKPEGLCGRLLPFAWILIPTVLSCLLLSSAVSDWKLPQNWYNTYMNDQATAQLILQAIASLLGFIQITSLYRLFNHATRLHLQRKSSSLEQLLFWTSVSNRRIEWSVRKSKVLALVFFALLSALPAAVWAGALTPIPTTSLGSMTLDVPRFKDMSHVKEYRSETIAKTVPEVRNRKGYFTYAVGIKRQGELLASAASATTLGNQPRKQAKFDSSGFSFVGRSYGVGGAVGLKDDAILNNDFIQSYTFQEVGYKASATCIHNATNQFVLSNEDAPRGSLIFFAQGPLPNSKGAESSRYFGWEQGQSIVAIGVASEPVDTRRYLAIAAGEDYQGINSTQCELFFDPAVFDVSVDTVQRTVSVAVASSTSVDMDPSKNLTYVIARQFELIANDQTNLYTSMVGNALNMSIATHVMDKSNSSAHYPFSIEDTMVGVTNSVTAMMDDMLVSYATAQLMIAGDMQNVPVSVTLKALRPGQDIYIYIIFVFNALIAVLTAIEGIRTRFWKGMIKFDYVNAAHMVLATSLATTPSDDSRSEYGLKTHPMSSSPGSEAQQLGAFRILLQARSAVKLKVQHSEFGSNTTWQEMNESQVRMLRRSDSLPRDPILQRSYTAGSDFDQRAPNGYEPTRSDTRGTFF